MASEARRVWGSSVDVECREPFDFGLSLRAMRGFGLGPAQAGAVPVPMDLIRHTYLHYLVEPLVYARAAAMDRLFNPAPANANSTAPMAQGTSTGFMVPPRQ